MSSHEGHDHPATKAARAACRSKITEHGNAGTSGIRTKADWEAAAEAWVGYRHGEKVADYANQGKADQALNRREVDAVAPKPQPRKPIGMPYWDADDQGRQHCPEQGCDYATRPMRRDTELTKLRASAARVKHLNEAHGQNW